MKGKKEIRLLHDSLKGVACEGKKEIGLFVIL